MNITSFNEWTKKVGEKSYSTQVIDAHLQNILWMKLVDSGTLGRWKAHSWKIWRIEVGVVCYFFDNLYDSIYKVCEALVVLGSTFNYEL